MPNPGPETDCAKVPGLSAPETSVLNAFQAWQVDNASGNAGALLKFPTCVVPKLATPVGETCVTDATVGWCELSAMSCTNAVVFSAQLRSEIKGATYALSCP
jgi:hypothetical protein